MDPLVSKVTQTLIGFPSCGIRPRDGDVTSMATYSSEASPALMWGLLTVQLKLIGKLIIIVYLQDINPFKIIQNSSRLLWYNFAFNIDKR